MSVPTGDTPANAMPEITGDPPKKLKRFRIYFTDSRDVKAATREGALNRFGDHVGANVTGIWELPE